MAGDVNRLLRDMMKVIREQAADVVWRSKQYRHMAHSMVLPKATLSPWAADSAFVQLYELAKANTLVDVYRCYELWDLAGQLKSVAGDVLEVGVWRGGTGVILASAVKAFGKTAYLADTFSGVVKAGSNDSHYKGGEHADTDQQVVIDLAEAVGADNVCILKGVFPDETSDKVSGPLAFLHVDVDVYESARDVLDWALPRLSIGSVIVFDDYGFASCDGITRLVEEFRDSHRNFLFLHNLNGHGVFVRLY